MKCFRQTLKNHLKIKNKKELQKGFFLFVVCVLGFIFKSWFEVVVFGFNQSVEIFLEVFDIWWIKCVISFFECSFHSFSLRKVFKFYAKRGNLCFASFGVFVWLLENLNCYNDVFCMTAKKLFNFFVVYYILWLKIKNVDNFW